MVLKVMKNNINIPNSLFRLRERDTATGFPNCSRPFACLSAFSKVEFIFNDPLFYAHVLTSLSFNNAHLRFLMLP